MNQITDKSSAGKLYVVATPIGNLGDISQRALAILKQVDLVLAEDTRHSKRLFNHFGISTPLKACHEHNELALIEWVIAKLEQGKDLALISDAGTPLISDPGYPIVNKLRAEGFDVVAIPGASSIVAALSIAGLPTDRFVFDGFLPAKSVARQKTLSEYLNQSRTIVLLESSHRILACVKDIVEVLGETRELVLARELTKVYETVISGTASSVLAILEADSNQCKGEFVLMLAGTESESSQTEIDSSRMLKELLNHLPLKKAASVVAELTGQRKNDLYELGLSFKDKK